MVICRDCKKEMSCITNGVQVRFGNGTHVYAGDEFECPTCYKRITVTNGTPFFDKKLATTLETVQEKLKFKDDKYNIWILDNV